MLPQKMLLSFQLHASEPKVIKERVYQNETGIDGLADALAAATAEVDGTTPSRLLLHQAAHEHAKASTTARELGTSLPLIMVVVVAVIFGLWFFNRSQPVVEAQQLASSPPPAQEAEQTRSQVEQRQAKYVRSCKQRLAKVEEEAAEALNEEPEIEANATSQDSG